MTDAEVITIPIGEAYPMNDTIIVTTQEEMGHHPPHRPHTDHTDHTEGHQS